MREGDFKVFDVAGKEGRSKEIGTQMEMRLRKGILTAKCLTGKES